MQSEASVRERPILFSGPMVRAILDGRKTQTRRVVKPQPPCDCSEEEQLATAGHIAHIAREDGSVLERPCPFGQTGDRLWVRETIWSKHDEEYGDYGELLCSVPILDLGPEYCSIDYVATPNATRRPKGKQGDTFDTPERLDVPGEWFAVPHSLDYKDLDGPAAWEFGRWAEGSYTKHPSIHMPRWASRITLEVTGVRVERLQDITPADAVAEGAAYMAHDGTDWSREGLRDPVFRHGWDSLNAGRGFGWDANPWVWVVDFKRLEVSGE